MRRAVPRRVLHRGPRRRLGLRGVAAAAVLLLAGLPRLRRRRWRGWSFRSRCWRSGIASCRPPPLVGFVGALPAGAGAALPAVPATAHGRDEPLRARRSTCWRCGRDFRRAPWAFAFAFVVTLLFALPLYLLKIEIVPAEAAWLPRLVFIAFIFPARLLTGWAMGRARRRDEPRHWFFRWTGRLPLLPVARLLRADRVLHAVHELERRVEPVRAARLPAAGAVLRDVTLSSKLACPPQFKR